MYMLDLQQNQKMFKNYNMLAFNDVIDLLTSELEEVNQAALAEKTKKDEYYCNIIFF